MAQLRFPRMSPALPELRYVRAPQRIEFPEEAEVPEGFAHLVVRTFLFRLLSFALGPDHCVGSEQFIFWDASNPGKRLAPDVFVRLHHPQPEQLGSWQTWKTGAAPDLAVEIVSPNEGDGLTWEEKLGRYHQLGVTELVRFDPEATEGARLRVWDRVDGDLVERQIAGDRTPCLTLGLAWAVRKVPAPSGAARAPEYLGLRLVDDEGRLLETQEERAEARAAEAQRSREEAQRSREEAQRSREEAQRAREAAEARTAEERRAREAAEARIRELEEQLRRRQS
ncbi:MAG TPA: Uma2 family endonuclease [Polyangiaceae bacterium]|jgi:Uma2 family endonuclease